MAAYRVLTDELAARGVTAIAYETVELPDGSLPLLAPMSEVAGRLAPQVGAQAQPVPVTNAKPGWKWTFDSAQAVVNAVGANPAVICANWARNSRSKSWVVGLGAAAVLAVMTVDQCNL